MLSEKFGESELVFFFILKEHPSFYTFFKNNHFIVQLVLNWKFIKGLIIKNSFFFKK